VALLPPASGAGSSTDDECWLILTLCHFWNACVVCCFNFLFRD
jgi:hypothetical protein